MVEIKLTIESTPNNVPLLAAALRGACQQRQLPLQTVEAVILGTVEAINNCIVHAYRERPDCEIAVSCSFVADQLTIEIGNNGEPITEPPNFGLPELNAENGRGWFIMSCCFDEVSYRAEDGRNVVALSKRLA